MTTILGITWNTGILVSFNPYTGIITEKHAWFKQGEDFVGLAYDYNQNMLYALAQVSNNLYSINPLTRDVKLVGKLNANSRAAAGLTYDPIRETLYTVIIDMSPDHLHSYLAKVNMSNAKVTIIGKIADGICDSLCWRDCDGLLNGYIKYGRGDWPDQDKESIVTINPSTAVTTTIFETSYTAITGLAKKPGINGYFTWINSDSHYYGEINLNSKTVITHANSDGVNVSSGAMIYRDFYVAPAPNLPPCSFKDEECLGLITLEEDVGGP